MYPFVRLCDVVLAPAVSQWTQAQQEALVRKVALLVPSSGEVEVRLLTWSAEPRSGHLLLELTASENTLVDGGKKRTKVSKTWHIDPRKR